MKETFYFSHDFNPSADPKIQAMIGEYGAVGYGLFWRIVEMLHTENDNTLQKKKYVFLALAKQMLTSVEQVETFVNDCISVFELFESDEHFFWSNRVNRNVSTRKSISESRSIAGKRSAESRKKQQKSTNVEQVLTSVEQNPTNINKEKESKEKESKEKNKYLVDSNKSKDSIITTQDNFEENEKPVVVGVGLLDYNGVVEKLMSETKVLKYLSTAHNIKSEKDRKRIIGLFALQLYTDDKLPYKSVSVCNHFINWCPKRKFAEPDIFKPTVEEGKTLPSSNPAKIEPPTPEQVQSYFQDNGYKPEAGLKAWSYYDAGDWQDSKNNPVKNWKQKMQSVWFKDENKIQQTQPRKLTVF